ncbi:hypothetical protein F5B20DRAFT_576233 [Whalleya microplaca]|nr:hypothetical protein F5B20DRAFT_576233 [Whalleya microplaca]
MGLSRQASAATAAVSSVSTDMPSREAHELQSVSELSERDGGRYTEEQPGLKNHTYITSEGLFQSGVDTGTPTRNERSHVFRYWAAEMTSLLVSFGSLMAIVGVLVRYDGAPQPDWPAGINLTSLVALLSTICRAMMLTPVAEALSELKWWWFKDHRPLRDLDRLDQASRGAWGSTRLLFGAFRMHLVMAAALLIIVSSAIGPFTQQAIRTTLCSVPVPDINATVPVSHYVNSTDDVNIFAGHGSPSFFMGNSMKSAIVNGLAAADDGSGKLNVTCPTGDCTFDGPQDNALHSYSSVGYCNQCTDVTSSIRQIRNMSDVLNLTMDATSYNPSQWISAAYASNWASIQAEGNPYAFITGSQANVNVSYMTFTMAPCTINETDPVLADNPLGGTFYNWVCPTSDYPNIPKMQPDVGLLAVNCTFYPCLRQYNARVTSGSLRETPVAASKLQGIPKNSTDRVALLEPCYIDGLQYDASNISQVPKQDGRDLTPIQIDGVNVTAPRECVYGMSTVLEAGITQFLSETLFDGQCWWDSVNYNNNLSRVMCADDVWWLQSLYGGGFATFASVDSLMQNVSLAITNRMRTVGRGADARSPGRALGTVWESTVCTHVDWRWMVLPFALELFTLCLLAAVVARNWRERARRPVWKSSVLPLLFHGLRTRDDCVDPSGVAAAAASYPFAASTQLGHMKNEADATSVRLVTEDGSSGFYIGDEEPDKLKRRRESPDQEIHRGRDNDLDSLLEGS